MCALGELSNFNLMGPWGRRQYMWMVHFQGKINLFLHKEMEIDFNRINESQAKGFCV